MSQKPSVVVHDCNPSIKKVETGSSWLGKACLKFKKKKEEKKQRMMVPEEQFPG